ncbi:unnamed protein product [Aureobasidium pullulans]|nr:unnamed protein product [Aureobasidium pullulans]
MFFFNLGGLFYVSVLLVNAIAILSEDRFLARIGWGSTQQEPAFGGPSDNTSVKSKVINLISSVRTLMRTVIKTRGASGREDLVAICATLEDGVHRRLYKPAVQGPKATMNDTRHGK